MGNNASKRENFLKHVVSYDVGNPGSGDERYRQGVGANVGAAGPRFDGGGDAYGIHYFPAHKLVNEFGSAYANAGPKYDEFGSLNPFWAEKQARDEGGISLGSDAFWDLMATGYGYNDEGTTALGGAHGDVKVEPKPQQGLGFARGIPDPSSVDFEHQPSSQPGYGKGGYFGRIAGMSASGMAQDDYEFPIPDEMWVPQINPAAQIPHGMRTGLERPVRGVVMRDPRGKTSVELEMEHNQNKGHDVRQHDGFDSREYGAALDARASDLLYGSPGHFGVV